MIMVVVGVKIRFVRHALRVCVDALSDHRPGDMRCVISDVICGYPIAIESAGAAGRKLGVGNADIAEIPDP